PEASFSSLFSRCGAISLSQQPTALSRHRGQIPHPTRNHGLAIQTRYILMPVSMLIKCEKCGYENFPQHRYCGMCAAELRIPGVPPPPPAPPSPRVPPVVVQPPKAAAPPLKEKETVPQQVSGPSFLGLGNEPAENRSFSYLLEDDTPSHRGRNVILILLIAAVAVAAWYWRQDVRVLASRFLNSPPRATNAGGSDNPEPNSPAPATSNSTSAPASASTATAAPPVDQPGAGANAQAPATPTPPPAATPSGAADATRSAQADQPQPANQSPASDAASTSTPKPDESEEAATPPPRPRKSETTRKQRAAASASQADDLEAQGEKYLYGNGVRENCARARTNLLAAAQHSSAQAQ